jgi:biopolymer transport protein TolQ
METWARSILQGSIFAKAILGILFILSIISWAIILERLRFFIKIRSVSGLFFRIYEEEPQLTDCLKSIRKLGYSPYGEVLKRGFKFVSSQRRQYGAAAIQPQEIPAGTAAARRDGFDNPNVREALRTMADDEVVRMERSLPFLSTTVSVSPFLGLMGTVWGIMTSFVNMGMKGSANIHVVGPGIADALITTIAGLAVAIPALVAYNYFLNKIRRFDQKMDHFILDMSVRLSGERRSS